MHQFNFNFNGSNEHFWSISFIFVIIIVVSSFFLNFKDVLIGIKSFERDNIERDNKSIKKVKRTQVLIPKCIKRFIKKESEMECTKSLVIVFLLGYDSDQLSLHMEKQIKWYRLVLLYQ